MRNTRSLGLNVRLIFSAIYFVFLNLYTVNNTLHCKVLKEKNYELMFDVQSVKF